MKKYLLWAILLVVILQVVLRFFIRIGFRLQHSEGMGGQIVPIDTWDNLPLPYPYGTDDLLEMIGSSFNFDDFKKVPIFIYMGERDDNGWALPWYIGTEDRSNYYLKFQNIFGSTAQSMSDSANKIYEALACSAKFVVFKDQDHQSANMNGGDILLFFQDHK